MCRQRYKISRQRFNLHWGKTDELVEAWVKDYNVGKPLREQLRTAHESLAKIMVRQYSIQLSYYQAYECALTPNEDQLPMYETNNTYLANKMGGTYLPRSVRNLRTRLRTAGFCLNRVKRGQNANFKLDLNWKCLFIQENNQGENVIDLFIPAFQELRKKQLAQHSKDAAETAKEATVEPQKKSEPAQFESTPEEKFSAYSNQLKEARTLNYILSGAPFQKPPENQVFSKNQDVRSSGDSVDKPEKAVENTQMSRALSRNQQEHLAGNTPNQANAERDAATSEDVSRSTSVIVPPANAPRTLEGAIAHLSEALKKKLRNQVSILWLYAADVLYSDTYLEPEDIELGKACLAEYFCYSKPGGWAGGNKEIMRRMMLVRLWIDRGELVGQQRFVPIPGSYFDIRKPKGFSQTKSWYKDDRKAVAEFVERGMFTKACNEYQKSCLPGAKKSTSDVYTKWKQWMGKRNPLLLDNFHKFIINVEKNKGAAA